MLEIQKNLTKTFYAMLALPATAVGFALSTQIAALSWILNKKFGLNIHEVAFVWLAGPLAGIFGQVIVGMISDNVWFLKGRRRPFIMIGGIVGALMFLALPQIGVISEATGITNIILIASVIALMLDLSINVTFNPARSIIADLTPEGKKRTAGYVWMQVISGTFGVLAYFLSMVYGNETLLLIAAAFVFVCSVFPILLIEEPKELAGQTEENQETHTVLDIFKSIFPLYGFLVFGVFGLIFHFYQNELRFMHNTLLILSLVYTMLIGAWIIIKGRKKESDKNEFQKIMLAHTFTWIAFQSMFVMSGFFIDKQIIPNLDLSNVFANKFAEFLTGVMQTKDTTTGNIVSLGFLILNAVGAVFPAVLSIVAKRIGRVRTYTAALAFSAIGYFYIAFFGRYEANFYFGMFLTGIGWSAVISIVFSIVTERVNQNKMGLFMGIFNLAVVLPQMMSQGVANIISDTQNFQLLYILCGVFITFSVFFWFFVKEPRSTADEIVQAKSGH
ncbi:MAG: MFS transporter [Ignavibacteriaceae bacterium]|nr:MFS transporter [Ignavibacteriaceae bacterium]HRN25218.1 MFS transporter [Ignavibacteriaceae bacterium]HRP94409.1 MFS transporter [Ignavibacteriaceae bacterium]HRQ52952.1 MFS transporter [Ignavibacteriaceae bacterium]